MKKIRLKSFKDNLNYSYVLIILIITVLTVPISLAFFYHLYYSSSMDNLGQITELAMQNIKYEYNNLERYAMTLSNNEMLRSIMQETDFGDKRNVTENFIRIRNEIKNLNYIGSENKIRIIFAKDGNVYNYDDLQSEDYFCSTYSLSRDMLDDVYIDYITEGKNKYLLYVRPVYAQSGDTERIGSIAVFYNLERNFGKFADINVSGNGIFIVTNDNGDILFHYKKEYILKNLREESFGDKLMNGKTSFRFREGSKSYFCAVEVMPVTNWRAISIMPMDKFYRDMIYYIVGMIAVCLAVVFMALNISKNYVNKITYPVNKICKAMKKTDTVDMDDNKLFAEFEFMAGYYNSMIDRIKKQMNEISEKEEAKRKADMRVLYEQINPHFLYNTLDSINWLASYGSDEYSEKVSEMVSLLAKMFRIGLSKGKEIITVADEIEHVKSYIKIQQMRHGNSFTTEYDIDPDILDCGIIKILLQPLAENAINHGFEEFETGGLIML